MFRTYSINYIYKESYHRAKYLILFYGISVLSYPFLILTYITIIRVRESFKEKMIETKQFVKDNIKSIIIPVVLASLFSILFKDLLDSYAKKLSIQHQNHIVGSYYVTMILMLVYFIVRSIIRADYYEAYYLKNKTDKRLYFIILLVMIMPIIVITFELNHFK